MKVCDRVRGFKKKTKTKGRQERLCMYEFERVCTRAIERNPSLLVVLQRSASFVFVIFCEVGRPLKVCPLFVGSITATSSENSSPATTADYHSFSMLDYCSNESNSPGYQQNPSPTTMASLLNMNMNVNMETSRQTAFVLSNPPLAALHNMTEMKIPTSTMLAQSGYPQTSLKQLQGLFASQSTPHGINDILGRPGNATTNTAFGVPRLNTTAATGMYFTPQTRFPKLAELPGRQPIYWPGVLPGSWRPQGKFCIILFVSRTLVLYINACVGKRTQALSRAEPSTITNTHVCM